MTADGNTITAGTTLKTGDTVIIYYSKGQAPSEVPGVVGKDLSEALIALSQAGFNNVVPMPEENDSYPENEVISQDPPSGTVASVDDTITVFYATAEPTAFIPVVAGMSKNEAKEELGDFTVEFRQIYDSEVEEGLVIRTSPEGGMNVPKGSTIVVYISKGPQPVKVTFDYGDGSRSTTETKYYEKPYGSLPTPTRNGYTFSGWYLSRAYTREITSSDTVNNSEDHTLYARWTAGEYTVSFNSNGGSAVSPIGVTYGKKYGNLPLSTKPGYTFDGWYTDSGEKVTADSTVNVDRNHTLNAKWRENTYTVSFNSNGGSSVSSISVKYGDTYGTLPTPKKDYYKFVGWYTSPSGGTKVSSGDTFNSASNITLYAQWQQNPISGWVEESKVPAGAQKVEYAYTYTETKESKSANEAKNDGWESAGTRLGDYGPWSEWSKTKAPEKDGRKFDKPKKVVDSPEKTVYWYKRYRYKNTNDGKYYVSYGSSWANNMGFKGEWQYKSTTEELPFYKNYSDGGKKYPGYGTENDHWWKADVNLKQGTEHTEFKVTTPEKSHMLYRYCDRETIYLYQRTVEKAPNYPSGSGISNVITYVKYRER